MSGDERGMLATGGRRMRATHEEYSPPEADA